MKRTLRLDKQEIKQLINDLNQYATNLQGQCEILLERLANEGIRVINATYWTGKRDPTTSNDHRCVFQIDERGAVTKGSLIVSGKDLLFIEFGAGISFNKDNEHPKAAELGYGVGTYPGQKHAYDENGWYYRKGNSLYHSFGTEATMPVYKASLEMMEKVEDIVEEVFGSGQLMDNSD